MGIDRIKEYLQYFGLGRFTEIDLPSENVGLVPDEEWVAGRMKVLMEFYDRTPFFYNEYLEETFGHKARNNIRAALKEID